MSAAAKAESMHIDLNYPLVDPFTDESFTTFDVDRKLQAVKDEDGAPVLRMTMIYDVLYQSLRMYRGQDGAEFGFIALKMWDQWSRKDWAFELGEEQMAMLRLALRMNAAGWTTGPLMAATKYLDEVHASRHVPAGVAGNGTALTPV